MLTGPRTSYRGTDMWSRPLGQSIDASNPAQSGTEAGQGHATESHVVRRRPDRVRLPPSGMRRMRPLLPLNHACASRER